MTKQQETWFDWLSGRQDADDMNSIATVLSALIANADPETLTRTENAMREEGVVIGFMHDPNHEDNGHTHTCANCGTEWQCTDDEDRCDEQCPSCGNTEQGQ